MEKRIIKQPVDAENKCAFFAQISSDVIAHTFIYYNVVLVGNRNDASHIRTAASFFCTFNCAPLTCASSSTKVSINFVSLMI